MNRATVHQTVLSNTRLIAIAGILSALLWLPQGYPARIANGAPSLQHLAANQTVLTAHGHGNRTTRTVAVPERWTLHWSFSCGTRRRSFQVTAYREGQHPSLARVTKHRRSAHGKRLVLTGGKVYLTVRSACSWHVSITRPAPAPPLPTATPTATATPTRTPSTTLAIHVSGNHLVNQNGQSIRLIGVNIPASAQCIPAGPHAPPGIFAFPSDSQTAAAVASWHANAVRIILNEDCWLGINGGNPAYTGAPYRTAIVDFIADLHARGIYVIICLTTNAPGTTPSSSAQIMADADHAPAFWTSAANTFKGDPAVIFQAYNEPHITAANAQTSNPWQCWLNGCLIDELDQYHNTPIPGAAPWQSAGMQDLVDTIRATGAANPILIDGLNWSQDLTGMLQYLPTDPRNQLIADYHNYMSPDSKNTPAYWNSVIAPIATKMPVITSEFGERDCNSTYVTQYMQWADQHDISYLPWVWMPWTCSAYGLITDWSGTPSTYGQIFYDHFHAVNPS